MFKKFILLLSLCFSFAFAEVSPSAVTSAVKANPALLNTPAAQAEMAKHGVSKSDVLSKIAPTDTKTVKKVTAKKAKNDLSTKKEVKIITEKRAVNKDSVFINPLQYKQNSAILKEVKIKQSIRHSKRLTRYGINFFKNRNQKDITSMPVPSYYILSPKDMLTIWIYGTKNEKFSLPINNNGNIDIPRYGPMHVAGMKFSDAQNFIKEKLKNVYLNTDVGKSDEPNAKSYN